MTKDQENGIMAAIVNCYVQLSPENVYRDGMASHREADLRRKQIGRELKSLFRSLGRTVSEEEAYRWHEDQEARRHLLHR